MPLKILEVIFNLKMKHETVGTIKDFISKKSNLNEFVTLVGDMQRNQRWRFFIFLIHIK